MTQTRIENTLNKSSALASLPAVANSAPATNSTSTQHITNQLSAMTVSDKEEKHADLAAKTKAEKDKTIDGFSAQIPSLLDAPLIVDGCTLGRGGFARVHKATYGGATIAVKVLTCYRPTWLTLFRNEAAKMRALQDFSLSCAVKFIGYREDQNTCQILMEYVEGQTLEALVDGYRGSVTQPIPFMTAAKLAVGLTESCAEIASKRILHCDLKPANFIVNKAGKFIAIDWCFAKSLNESADFQGDEPRGTAAYMAPEIIKNAKFSPATETYAVACTLYFLAHSDDPFYNKPRWGDFFLMSEVAKGVRAKISTYCDPRFAKLITWGWDQDPKKRPTMQALHEECKLMADPTSKPNRLM